MERCALEGTSICLPRTAVNRTGRGSKERTRRKRVSGAVSVGLAEALGVALSVAIITFVMARNTGGSGQRPSTPTAPARAGKQPAAPKSHLVFTSNRDGDSDVYAASLDGNRIAVLTRNRASDELVDVARDGRILAMRDFSTFVLVSADGRHERRVGGGDYDYEGTFFALGGKAIVLSREDSYGETESMFLVRVAGGATQSLGPGLAMEVSRDGRYLVFANMELDRLGIYDLERMTKRTVSARSYDQWVGFAPGGARFAYIASANDDEDGEGSIFVVDAADPDAKPVALYRGRLDADSVVWRDANSLVFTRDVTGLLPSITEEHSEADLVDARNARLTVIDTAEDAQWSPRGDRVAYVVEGSPPSFVGELVLARTDGSRSRVIRRAESFNDVSWSPRGGGLSFFADSHFFVVDPNGRQLLSLRTEGEPTWAPDDSAIAFAGYRGLSVVTLREKRLRRVVTGTETRDVRWTTGALPPRAPSLRSLPPVEVSVGSGVKSRGKILEIASSGPWVAGLVDSSRTDCSHVFGWRPGSRTVVRFRASAPCDTDDAPESYSALTLKGTSVTWSTFSCGNFCYGGGYKADLRRPGSETSFGGDALSDTPGEGTPKPRPRPPDEVHRGIAVAVASGTIQLRRVADGQLRTIRPPGGAIDAELESIGLFYAYNIPGVFPGHLVFVPFDQLFSG